MLGTALLVTLTRPTTWLLALAAFLIRGGIVWFLVPILVLPTPVGLANALGPSIVEFVFGGLTLGVILLLVVGVGLVLLWVIGGGLAAASLELALIHEVAGDVGLAAPDVGLGPGDAPVAAVPRGRTLRVLAVRLVAAAPLVVAILFGSTRIVAATYAELTLPSDTATPIAWRVLTAVPEAVLLLVITWVFAEVIGALATRRVGLGDPSMVGALRGALVETVRHPLRTLTLFGIPTVALMLVLVPSAAAATVAWSGLRTTLADPGAGLLVGLALIAFVGLWAGGLVLAGAACAWRAAAWTVDAVALGRGTFGGSDTDRPGDWKSAAASGTV